MCYRYRMLMASCVDSVCRERVVRVYCVFIECVWCPSCQLVFRSSSCTDYPRTVHVRTAKRYVTVRARDMWSEAKDGWDGLGGVVTWHGGFIVDVASKPRVDNVAAAHDTTQDKQHRDGCFESNRR